MELLRQLEAKLHALVQQRNELREEIERMKTDKAILEEELEETRRQREDLQSEKANFIEERNEVRVQIEGILGALEELA